MLIEIEGIDGVGKTTQCELLKSWFLKKGKLAIIVKDFESTKLGKSIKEFIVSDELKSRKTELLSILACKSHLFSNIIISSLEKNSVVICDRGIGSFISYFESFGFERKFLSRIVRLSTSGFRPDLTFLIDVSVEEAIRRNGNKQEQSKFDKMEPIFFYKQREIFLELSRESSWVKINGGDSIKHIHLMIVRLLEKKLSQKELCA